MNTPEIITRIDEHKFYSITNNTDETITLAWNSEDYVFDPGEPVLVPFGLLANWFGDPRSTPGQRLTFGTGKKISIVAKREDEVKRILHLWGDIEDGTDESLPRFVPDVTLAFPNGDKIESLRDDPAGKGVTIAMPSISNQEAMAEELASQRELIARLEAQINAAHAKETGQVKIANPKVNTGA